MDITRVVDFVDSHKRINRDAKTVKSEIEILSQAVVGINAATELEIRAGGELLSQIELPFWVKPFVYPTKVSILPGAAYKDLVVRPTANQWQYDAAAVTNAARKVGQFFKDAEVRMVKASELRGDPAVLSQIKWMSSGWVYQERDDEFFYPVPLVDTLNSVIGDEWGNMKADRMIQLFFARTFSMTEK